VIRRVLYPARCSETTHAYRALGNPLAGLSKQCDFGPSRTRDDPGTAEDSTLVPAVGVRADRACLRRSGSADTAWVAHGELAYDSRARAAARTDAEEAQMDTTRFDLSALAANGLLND
jgi:hypothetical protein